MIIVMLGVQLFLALNIQFWRSGAFIIVGAVSNLCWTEHARSSTFCGFTLGALRQCKQCQLAITGGETVFCLCASYFPFFYD